MRFFKTRSIIHVTGTNIYIYTRTCVYRIIWRCSGTYPWIYWRIKEMDIVEFFFADIKYYLNRITKKSIQ